MSPKDSSARPALLSLPLELRQQIYSYLLPKTLKLHQLRRENGREYAWERGNITLLMVNRQIHAETIAMLYGGTNVFVLQVDYDGTRLQFQRIMKTGLIPKQTPWFLDKVQIHNIRYLKHLIINVNHVDSYAGSYIFSCLNISFYRVRAETDGCGLVTETGMINYNCGGRGLTSGLKLQVKKLVDVLKTAEELVCVRVHLIDHGFTFGMAAEALEPFVELQNVSSKIEVSGVTNPNFLDTVRRKYQDSVDAEVSKPKSKTKSNGPLPDLVCPDVEFSGFDKKVQHSANSQVFLSRFQTSIKSGMQLPENFKDFLRDFSGKQDFIV